MARTAVVVGREARRRERHERFVAEFGPHAELALDLMDLTDMAWHDCFGDVAVPDHILDNVLVVAGGDLANLISAARLAVIDWRDLQVFADKTRGQ